MNSEGSIAYFWQKKQNFHILLTNGRPFFAHVKLQYSGMMSIIDYRFKNQ